MSTRKFVCSEQLPFRATPAERIATLDKDAREASDKIKRLLMDFYTSKYSVTGWTANPDDIILALVTYKDRPYLMQGELTITRPD